MSRTFLRLLLTTTLVGGLVIDGWAQLRGGGSRGGGRGASVSRPSGGSLGNRGGGSGSLSKPGGNIPSIGGSGSPSIGGGNRPSLGSGSRGSGTGFVPKKPSSSGSAGASLGANRPNLGSTSRPNIGGGNLPNVGAGNRPNIGTGAAPGAGNRPNIGNAPNIGSGNRPTIGSGNVGIGNRPNIGSGNRPNIGNGSNIGSGNRPNIGNGSNIGSGNRPNIGNGNIASGNRPQIGSGNNNNIGIGNRPQIGNNTGINIDNSTNIGSGNRPWYSNQPTRPAYDTRPGINVGSGNNNINTGNIASGNNVFAPTVNRNVNNYNSPVVAGRPWYGQPWNAPTYYNHYGWHSGYWNYWPSSAYVPLAAYTTGVATGWLLSGPKYVYTNPYCCTTPVTSNTTIVYDYSQPIPVAAPAAPTEVNVTTNVTTAAPATTPDPNATASSAPPEVGLPPEDPKTQAAIKMFDEARAAFKQGDYNTALTKVNSAIEQLPSDPVLHEFRGLVLFAKGDYPQAAGTIYAVLAAGPGWDWETVSTLYPNTETYEKQIQALQKYCADNPDAADGRFLLGYHYLTLGYTDEAKAELEQVVKLQPNDELSAQLVKLLNGESVGGEGTANG